MREAEGDVADCEEEEVEHEEERSENYVLTSFEFRSNMLSLKIKLGTSNSRQVERFHLLICHMIGRLPAVARCLKTSYRATIQVFYNKDFIFHELRIEIHYFINSISFNSVYHRCRPPPST